MALIHIHMLRTLILSLIYRLSRLTLARFTFLRAAARLTLREAVGWKLILKLVGASKICIMEERE
ncbi:uncharacterized protein TrAFT101_011396 [Trichoderma asperellum]|uniref:uncharacterized protein n=1 Tax=Trichoderma asperellum TaxID=101201 RepID=UPI00332B0B34|nr:hypothetical protein TrAFT101_011396 [Trichoderma asperellum]